MRRSGRSNQATHGDTWGAGGQAAGLISIHRTGDATRVYNVIVAGVNMSLNSARMVPAGKIFYMTGFSMMAGDNTSVSVRLRATSTFEDTLTSGWNFLFKSISPLQNSGREKVYSIPKKYPALCIIKATGFASSNGAGASVEYEGWLE